MIINRIYETQYLLSVAVACLLPGRTKDLSAPLYIVTHLILGFFFPALIIILNLMSVIPMCLSNTYKYNNTRNYISVI